MAADTTFQDVIDLLVRYWVDVYRRVTRPSRPSRPVLTFLRDEGKDPMAMQSVYKVTLAAVTDPNTATQVSKTILNGDTANPIMAAVSDQQEVKFLKGASYDFSVAGVNSANVIGPYSDSVTGTAGQVDNTPLKPGKPSLAFLRDEDDGSTPPTPPTPPTP